MDDRLANTEATDANMERGFRRADSIDDLKKKPYTCEYCPEWPTCQEQGLHPDDWCEAWAALQEKDEITIEILVPEKAL